MLRFKSDCSTKFKLVSVIFPFSYSRPQNDFKLGTEDTSLPSDYQLDSKSSTLRPDDEDESFKKKRRAMLWFISVLGA